MVDYSDTPAGMVSRLDAALERRGETVIVRRFTGTGNPRPKTDVTGIKASIRAQKADELVGTITQTLSKAILSPTGLASVLPVRKGDKLIVQGRERNIETVMPIVVRDVLVRIELLIEG